MSLKLANVTCFFQNEIHFIALKSAKERKILNEPLSAPSPRNLDQSRWSIPEIIPFRKPVSPLPRRSLDAALPLYPLVFPASKSSYECFDEKCTGSLKFDGHVTDFNCPKCRKNNCIKCNCIHEGKTCDEFAAENAKGFFSNLYNYFSSFSNPSASTVPEKAQQVQKQDKSE